MLAVGLLLQLRQQGLQRCPHIAHKPQLKRATPAKLLGADVDLRDPDAGGQELLVGKSVPSSTSVSQACIAS